MQQNYHFIDIVVLLATAVVVVPLFRFLRLGSVPGFLISGLLIGPSGFRLITEVEEIRQLAELGVVLLMFIIGIELKPARLWLLRRLVFGLGSAQVILTGAVICGLSIVFLDIPWRAAVVVGPALALSSTAFVLQLLVERKALPTERGRAAFGILLFQDLAVVPLLMLVPLLAIEAVDPQVSFGLALGKAVTILGGLIIAGKYFLQPVLRLIARHGTPEIFTAGAILLVLGTALLTAEVGLSMALGAFIAGILIAESPYRHQILTEILPFRGLLLGLFFMSMGMSVNLSHALEAPLRILAILAALLSIKVLIAWPLVRLFHLPTNIAGAVALLLAQSGEFGLAVFAIALGAGLLSPTLFQDLVLVVILSMAVTPIFAFLSDRLSAHDNRDAAPAFGDEERVQSAVLIAGYGRVGRRIGEILELAKVPFVAVDRDTEIVGRESTAGRPVFYGDLNRFDVLRAAGLEDVSSIVITLDDDAATQSLLHNLRAHYPDMPIFVRAHDLEGCQAMLRAGATFAVSETLETSMDLAGAILESSTSDKGKDLLDTYRTQYYQQIRNPTQNES